VKPRLTAACHSMEWKKAALFTPTQLSTHLVCPHCTSAPAFVPTSMRRAHCASWPKVARGGIDEKTRHVPIPLGHVQTLPQECTRGAAPTYTKCARCDTAVPDEPAEDRMPYSTCGSKSRKVHVFVEKQITLRGGLATKAKRDGERKPFIEDMSVP